MREHKIAVIPGDGIGPEVIEEGVKVLKATAGVVDELEFEFKYFPWGCEYYLTLDDFEYRDKTVLLRVDINSPN